MAVRRFCTALVITVLTGSASAGVATLTRGEAYVDGYAFTGSGANSTTIDERVDWDGVTSFFEGDIDETKQLLLLGEGATVDIDNTIQTAVR